MLLSHPNSYHDRCSSRAGELAVFTQEAIITQCCLAPEDVVNLQPLSGLLINAMAAREIPSATPESMSCIINAQGVSPWQVYGRLVHSPLRAHRRAKV